MMEGQEIYYTQQQEPMRGAVEFDESILRNEIEKQFQLFLEEWHTSNKFTYRDQLNEIKATGTYTIVVDTEDLISYDENTHRTELNRILRNKPADAVPLFEQAARKTFAKIQNVNLKEVPEFQVQIISTENPISLRELRSNKINQLVTVQGIVVNSQRVQLKASKLCIKCKQCAHEKLLEIGPGMSIISLPRFCLGQRDPNTDQKDTCPNDPYVIIPEQSHIIDQQILKIQETAESVPSGEIPRTFQICMDRYLANKLMPGSRVKLTGIYNVIEKKNSNSKNANQVLRIPYIYVVGFQAQNIRNQGSLAYTNEEIEKFNALANDPESYDKISKTIASQIYGSEDIKKAISCLLFGGSKKQLPDKTRLRGDINVLLIGDPSTAKSQFLKFVERVAPIAVYTSGKGSSAAGLTASIIRDPSTREFQLEGGAMVLADGGIVCIDEFDKMKPEDRVSIHEAMEQQTISIAKAGICTILNSRTSVLAAANPIFGRYDDLKAISDQIELQTTILSRFDCIFIVRDIRSEEHDKMLANHILDLHMNKHQMEVEQQDLSLEFLKKYIHYSRQKFSPRLTEEAAKTLQNLYVEDRKKVSEAKKSKKSHIPITVRQLEAIIRLSESLAKMRLQNEVKEVHVNEAHRLFAVSTLNAIQNGLEQRLDIPEQLAPLVLKVEESIKRRVATGGKISYAKLSAELTNRFLNQQAVEIAILNMVKNGDFKQSEGSKMLQRIK